MRLAYSTPKFSPSDPLVCHSLRLRPSLWEAVFGSLGDMGEAWSWRQDDPSNATVDQVTAEVQAATDSAIFSGCIMIGQIVELAVGTPPSWMLRCDGAVYAVADYPDLAAVLHPAYFEDADHFRVPDRNDRLGRDGVYPAMQGGENEHAITPNEVPEHFHNYRMPILEASTTLGELTGFGFSYEDGAETETAFAGDQPLNMRSAYEGTQFYIVASYPTAG